MDTRTLETQCCIAGGGPAGIMLGFLLARAGVDVVVLEKWPDFFRDFRGDTIHPSVMELLFELDLLEEFLQLPHNEVREVEADIANERVVIADFSHLRVHCPYLAFIPQWDFLTFLSTKAKRYPGFHLLMETEATDLIRENGSITGVRAKDSQGEIEIRADLVVAADGRHSTLRERAGLVRQAYGAPMDVLWFRISRKESDPDALLGKADRGKMMILIDRKDYWQAGFLIRKGEFETLKQAGLDSFRQNIAALAPALRDRVGEITDWDQIKLLTVTVDRLLSWHQDNLLCIGDSAHAMSPIGGVGINLAIQDAVAAANVLAPAFARGKITVRDLIRIQKRRELPVKIIQRMQVLIQTQLIDRVLSSRQTLRLPWQFKLLRNIPILRRIPAYLIGIGFRAEHVETADVLK